MPAVRLTYLVALILAALVALGVVVVPKIANANHAREGQAALVAADASFAHLKVPSSFRPLSASSFSCAPGFLCYHVAEPTTTISKASLIAVLHSTGAVFDSRRSYCSTFLIRHSSRSTQAKTCFVYARLDGLYVSAVLRGYDPYAWRPGLSGSLVWIARPFTPSD